MIVDCIFVISEFVEEFKCFRDQRFRVDYEVYLMCSSGLIAMDESYGEVGAGTPVCAGKQDEAFWSQIVAC